ncbi:hypothetical protein Dsin_021890, partial [Dipteronia sinensis]
QISRSIHSLRHRLSLSSLSSNIFISQTPRQQQIVSNSTENCTIRTGCGNVVKLPNSYSGCFVILEVGFKKQ